MHKKIKFGRNNRKKRAVRKSSDRAPPLLKSGAKLHFFLSLLDHFQKHKILLIRSTEAEPSQFSKSNNFKISPLMLDIQQCVGEKGSSKGKS